MARAERGGAWRGGLAALAALAAGAAFGQGGAPAAAAPASASASAPASAARGPAGPRTGFDRLIGGWSRTDGNYHIVVQAVAADGLLQASYFNPRPLPFALAQARREGGVVHVRFVLDAGGYAGSTYDLRLEADGARLVGSYYQAVAKQRFDVEFVRR